MIAITEHPLTQDAEWQAYNEDLLAQAKEERESGHLWNASVLGMQAAASEAKRREMLASREESRV